MTSADSGVSMAKSDGPRNTFCPKNRAQWRSWLEKNHATVDGVWLVFYKKGAGTSGVTYDESVEEALCFGWVDSRTSPLDDRRYLQWFSPRKPGSSWARTNKERVERLIREGLMTAAGLAKVEAAQRDGSWTALDAVEALTIPPDLEQALAARPPAAANFQAFSRSSKKIILGWIASAKRPETRARRVRETAELAARNLKANHDRP
jgi:uncharacterized protein YdeI (YjbR/CyaY-like superfamily)